MKDPKDFPDKSPFALRLADGLAIASWWWAVGAIAVFYAVSEMGLYGSRLASLSVSKEGLQSALFLFMVSYLVMGMCRRIFSVTFPTYFTATVSVISVSILGMALSVVLAGDQWFSRGDGKSIFQAFAYALPILWLCAELKIAKLRKAGRAAEEIATPVLSLPLFHITYPVVTILVVGGIIAACALSYRDANPIPRFKSFYESLRESSKLTEIKKAIDNNASMANFLKLREDVEKDTGAFFRVNYLVGEPPQAAVSDAKFLQRRYPKLPERLSSGAALSNTIKLRTGNARKQSYYPRLPEKLWQEFIKGKVEYAYFAPASREWEFIPLIGVMKFKTSEGNLYVVVETHPDLTCLIFCEEGYR